MCVRACARVCDRKREEGGGTTGRKEEGGSVGRKLIEAGVFLSIWIWRDKQ